METTTYHKGIAIKKVGTYNCRYYVSICGLLRTFFSRIDAKKAIDEYSKRTKYSVYKSVMENIVAGYYELTGKTDNETLKEYGYEFVCFANTAKEAERMAKNLWY